MTVSDSQLRVGFGETDITPPEGLFMCGSLDPRRNEGTTDPLQSHALVAESGGKLIAIVGVDLIGLPKALTDPIIAEASRRTGIASDAILIACSHTHSGPYTAEGVYSSDVIDADYLATLPDRIAASVEEAAGRMEPVSMHIGRSLVHHGIHNRRVICPDGKVMNTWMPQALNDLAYIPQVYGTAGPVDPEMWVVRFDRLDGSTIGVFYNYSLHTNSKGGTTWSADYPCVVAEQMREEYGPEVISVYTPGACADINVTLGGVRWREGATYFAEQAVDAARRAIAVEGPIEVGAVRRDITVPRRDLADYSPEAIARLNWGGAGGRADVFDRQAELVACLPEEWDVPVNAARIGPLAIASNPGELFVEHGLSIKRRSPFPYTVVAELTNDLAMYQPTAAAFEQEGYECLVGPNRIALEGVERIVDTAVELVEALWDE
ncbi:MAG: hypothetical protein F4Z82_13815 [Caldilineaceae bacterium SB0668_bin_21]|nr:hypothetical protein [Caldilineaceae bacterium SB0668_bin_21]